MMESKKWWDNPTAAVGALMGEKAQAMAEYQITKKLQAEYERGYADGRRFASCVVKVKNQVKRSNGWYGECGNCGNHVLKMPFCPKCGCYLFWEDAE